MLKVIGETVTAVVAGGCCFQYRVVDRMLQFSTLVPDQGSIGMATKGSTTREDTQERLECLKDEVLRKRCSGQTYLTQMNKSGARCYEKDPQKTEANKRNEGERESLPFKCRTKGRCCTERVMVRYNEIVLSRNVTSMFI